jgi:hypothetical protein
VEKGNPDGLALMLFSPSTKGRKMQYKVKLIEELYRKIGQLKRKTTG